MAINKVIYDNQTIIDLTDTTAETADVMNGKYFYTKAGVRTVGTGGVDGDELGYGDPTIPMVGSAQIDSAVI